MTLVQITRRLGREEIEVFRKREELNALRGTLAEHESEFVDLRSQLAGFESRFLRQMDIELNKWKARISWLRPLHDPSVAREEGVQGERPPQNDTHENISESGDYIPSAEIKNLFKEFAERMHSDTFI